MAGDYTTYIDEALALLEKISEIPIIIPLYERLRSKARTAQYVRLAIDAALNLLKRT